MAKDSPNGLKVRTVFNLKVNIPKITEFIGCNAKGIYYIENNLLDTKSVRYLMYMRKQGLNVNKLVDQLNEKESERVKETIEKDQR